MLAASTCRSTPASRATSCSLVCRRAATDRTTPTIASDNRLNVSFTAPRPRTGLESNATRSDRGSRPPCRAAATLFSKATASCLCTVSRARKAWNVLLANGASTDANRRCSATFQRTSYRQRSTTSASDTPS